MVVREPPSRGAPPERSPETESDEWFDLFFDLVFAAAVALWAERLSDHPTVDAYGRGIAELLPIWLLWLGQTVFAARFPVDGATDRVLALADEAGAPGTEAARGVGFMAAGLSLWIVGLVLVRAVVLRHRDRFWHWPFLAAGVLFPALATVAAMRHPIATLGVYVVVLFAMLALEQRHGRAHAGAPHRL